MTECPDLGLRTPDADARRSPFVSIWFEPSSTIKQVAGSSPMRLYHPLAAVWGASFLLERAIRKGVSAEALSNVGIESVWVFVAVSLVVGAVCGVAVLWLLLFFFAWIGRFFGGVGRALEIRTVFAWSSVPCIPTLAVAVVVLLVGGMEALTGPHPKVISVSSHPLLATHILGGLVLGIWGFVISVAGMKAIMRISTLRVIGVYLFAGIIMIAVVVVTVLGFAQLTRR